MILAQGETVGVHEQKFSLLSFLKKLVRERDPNGDNSEKEESSQTKELKEKIPYTELQQILKDFEQGEHNQEYQKALRSVSNIDPFNFRVAAESEGKRFVRTELFGMCVAYSNELQSFLKEKGYESERIANPPLEVHKILKVHTDQGIVYLDSTIGQFIQYPRVFIGTKVQLQEVFMNEEEYQSLYGTIVYGHTGLDTREKWFNALYGYLE